MVQCLGISQVAQSLSRIIPYPAYPAPTHDLDSWCSRRTALTAPLVHGADVNSWRMQVTAGCCSLASQILDRLDVTGLLLALLPVPSVFHRCSISVPSEVTCSSSVHDSSNARTSSGACGQVTAVSRPFRAKMIQNENVNAPRTASRPWQTGSTCLSQVATNPYRIHTDPIK